MMQYIVVQIQNYALIDNKTVRYNLKLAQNIVKSDISVEDALKFVGLSDKIDSKVVELSGGEQQRVALARAFIKKSNLILADEPTGSLDQANRNNVLKLFKELQKQGTTIIMVTHDEEIKMICDREISLQESVLNLSIKERINNENSRFLYMC